MTTTEMLATKWAHEKATEMAETGLLLALVVTQARQARITQLALASDVREAHRLVGFYAATACGFCGQTAREAME